MAAFLRQVMLALVGLPACSGLARLGIHAASPQYRCHVARISCHDVLWPEYRVGGIKEWPIAIRQGRTLINHAVDRATAERSDKNVIHGHIGDLKLGPQDWSWLYLRWRGTVLRLTWVPILLNTGFAMLLVWAIRFGSSLFFDGPSLGPLFTTPSPDHPVIRRLAPLYMMWSHHSTLTTFILTFFLTESFGYWRRTLCESRKIQRALVNIALLQSTHAARDATTGEHTAAARESLAQTAQELRLMQTLFWSHMLSTKTLGVLHSKAGLRRLEQRGVLSASQHAALKQVEPSRRHDAVLQWLGARLVAQQGLDKDSLEHESVGGLGHGAPAISPAIAPGLVDGSRTGHKSMDRPTPYITSHGTVTSLDWQSRTGHKSTGCALRCHFP